MPTTVFYRVKYLHRPYYSGFTACVFHARQLKDQGQPVEIAILDPKDILPLPAHAVASGHTHCHTCNREKGLASAPGSVLRLSQG